MMAAGELAGWEPSGLAFVLSRPQTWDNPWDTSEVLLTAMRNVSNRPDFLREWVKCGLIGLTKDQDTKTATHDAALLIHKMFLQPWINPETISFIIQGLTDARSITTNIGDALLPALERLHKGSVDEYGHWLAKARLTELLSLSTDAAKSTANHVILSTT